MTLTALALAPPFNSGCFEMSRSLSERERVLLMCLRESEAARQPVDLTQLAHKTGYTLTTIRTYFTKKLGGEVARQMRAC